MYSDYGEPEAKGCWRSFFGPLVIPSQRDDELVQETHRKWLLLPSACIVGAVCFVFSAMYLARGMLYDALPTLIMMLLCIALVVLIRTTKTLTARLTEVSVFCLCVYGCVVLDIKNRGQYDLWTWTILGMDLFLLSGCNGLISLMRVVVVVYLAVKSVEEVLQLGLYDAFPSSVVDRECKAMAPMTAVVLFVMRCVIFNLDFMLTKRFAEGMRDEEEKMRKTISVMHEVTTALVRFNLDDAEKSLARGDLDEDILSVLEGLLDNLHVYRPYLPDTLFVDQGDETAEADQGRPPGDSGFAAIVFTDIQSSTAIWESNPHAMRLALLTHNTIIRQCIQKHNGYEVKTIGDAFMIAFDSTYDAVLFCLRAQDALYSSDWPTDLENHSASAKAKGVWNGLRLRMGVHYGPVEVQINPLTGRADYFGTTVNKAARVEGIALGGTVAVTPEVVKELGSEGLMLLNCPCTMDMGCFKLRGLETETEVTAMVPAHLSGRLHRDPSAPRDSIVSTISTRSRMDNRLEPVTKMQVSCGAVACIRVDYDFLNHVEPSLGINQVLGTVVESVERTDGNIVSICSSTIAISWNAGKRCKSYTTQSARCVGLIWRAAEHQTWKTSISAGCVCGGVFHGSIGTVKQRFIVFVGEIIELAASLSAAASYLTAFLLTASVSGGQCLAQDPSMKAITRPVDVWEVKGEEVVLFQVDVARMDKWGMVEGADAGWGWSDMYRHAFAEMSPAALQSIEEKAGGDTVLLRVAELLRTGTHAAQPATRNIDPILSGTTLSLQAG